LEFQTCLSDCRKREHCEIDEVSYFERTCDDNCADSCMDYLRSPVSIKYKGKWPLKPVFDAQEFSSVLFSLGNLVANYNGVKEFYTTPTSYGLRKYFLVFGTVLVLYYLSSMLYHYRPTAILSYTEQVLQSLVFLLTSLLGINLLREKGDLWTNIYFLVIAIIHIYLLEPTGESVVYSKFICYFYGIVTSLAWTILYWSRGRETNRKPYYWKYMWWLFLMWCFSVLEMLDVGPFMYYTLDGHALWHAGSIIPWHWFWTASRKEAILTVEEKKVEIVEEGKWN